MVFNRFERFTYFKPPVIPVDYDKKFSQNALTYVKKIISWDIVAHQTLNVYKQFDRERVGKGINHV